MLAIPLLVAVLGLSRHVIGSRHQKSDGPPINAKETYLIRVNPNIEGLKRACDYMKERCTAYVHELKPAKSGPKSSPLFSCSSGGQLVNQATPYLYASCHAATNAKGGPHRRDVSFNAFAGSKNAIVFLRSDEESREVEIDQDLYKIESKKWKPLVNHKYTDKTPAKPCHHDGQGRHAATGGNAANDHKCHHSKPRVKKM